MPARAVIARRLRRIANFVLFQAVWFVAVMGVSRGWSWQAPAFAAAFVGVHLAWLSERPGRDAGVLAIVPLLGLGLDTLLMHGGVLRYGGSPLVGVLAPAWILALWLGFSATFHSSMSWLQGRHGLAAVFGALGAPLSYLGGARLGAISLGEPPWLCALAVALAWGIGMPLFLWISAQAGEPATATRTQSSNDA